MTSGMEGSIPYEAGSLLSAGSSPVPLSKFLFVSSSITQLTVD
jgi:hypothetical protein